MPIAHRREERSNLLGCERIRLLLGVGDVCAGIEPLHLHEWVVFQPELVDRLIMMPRKKRSQLFTVTGEYSPALTFFASMRRSRCVSG